MRRRTLLTLTALLLAAGPARAQSEPVPFQDRNWRLGVMVAGIWNDRFDVFGRPQLPAGEVRDKGEGGGFFLGRRFGHRFLLDLQVIGGQHEVDGDAETMTGFWGLLNGTILFRHQHRLQPFLRGGIGGGGWSLDYPDGGGSIYSLGTGALAGGGLQVRLGGRWSLEVEAATLFMNHLQVGNETSPDQVGEKNWQVRVSSQAWRLGAGLSFWF